MGIVEPQEHKSPPPYTPEPTSAQVVHPPQVVYVVQQVQAPRWQHGIFECFRDIPNALSACCFPCWRQALTGGRAGVLSCGFLFAITVGLWMLMQVNDTMYQRAVSAEFKFVVDSCPSVFTTDGAGKIEMQVSSQSPSKACQEAVQILFHHILPYLGAWVCLILSKILIAVVIRGRVRAKYGIAGSVCEDTCCHVFCHTCAIAQEGYTVDMLELGRSSPFSLSADVVPVASAAQYPQVELNRVV